MVDPVYTTREVVKAALDSAETARNNAQVDRCIDSASRAVEGILHRKFYPWVGTRHKNYPTGNYSAPHRLWLDADEVISVSAITSGGLTIAPSDYFLEPANEGPPFNRIELDTSSSASFNGTSTAQRSVAITGTFGYWDRENPAGTLAEALDDSETFVDVSDSSLVGVGSILKCESERMLVYAKMLVDTAQDTTQAVDNKASSTGLKVGSGAAFTQGETITVDSERMFIEDIAGNTLIVKRAFDGSVLAAHDTGSSVYAPRTLAVTRGALGTTAASHNTATAVTTHAIPGLVSELTVAIALQTLGQRQAGYARTVGEGESQREASYRGVAQICKDAIAAYGRQLRSQAV